MTTADASRALHIATVTVRAHIKSGVLAATWNVYARQWEISDAEVARYAVERRAAHRPRREQADAQQ